MNLPDEIYVVITEHDGNPDNPKPFIMETYVNESCSKAEVMKQVNSMNNRYGDVKIGRLVFDEDKSTADLVRCHDIGSKHSINVDLSLIRIISWRKK